LLGEGIFGKDHKGSGGWRKAESRAVGCGEMGGGEQEREEE
jgi:hypothetical protein